MSVPDSGLAGCSEVLFKVVSPEGQTFIAYFPEDTLIEEVKNKAIDYFYPSGESDASRYKIVRVLDTNSLHEFLAQAQEQVSMQELILVERRLPEAGALGDDLGAVRAPQPGSSAAATAALPPPMDAVRQPLQTEGLEKELCELLLGVREDAARHYMSERMRGAGPVAAAASLLAEFKLVRNRRGRY